MEEQIRRLSPGDVAGYRAFVEYARQVFEKGYEELAGVPFLRFADMVKVAPDLIRLRADRSVYGVVKRFVRGRPPAPGAELPLAPRGREPLRDERHLHAHPLPRAELGRLLPARRDRARSSGPS